MLLEGLPGSAAKSGKQLGPGDELLASIKDVRKAQQVTDKKLRKLVERVDRMIRRRNK